MRYFIIAAFLILCCTAASAQEISFKDTVRNFNLQRIRTEKTGAYVLGGWGIANMATGAYGYFNAEQDEWKYFHGMNAAWGVLNTFIAADLLNRCNRERRQNASFEQSYKRYRSDKRHYLISACFDVVYIGVGIGLTKYGDKAGTDNPALFTGFGRSVTMQGAFLLVFDNIMYASLMRSNSRWRRIMGEIRFTGNGMGFNYNIKGRTERLAVNRIGFGSDQMHDVSLQ